MEAYNIIYSVFRGLSVTNEGGALNIHSYSNVVISQCLIQNCQSAVTGGGIYTQSYSLSLENTCFENCIAPEALAMKTMRIDPPPVSSSSVSGCSVIRCTQTHGAGAQSGACFFIVQHKSQIKQTNFSRITINHVATAYCESTATTISNCEDSHVNI